MTRARPPVILAALACWIAMTAGPARAGGEFYSVDVLGPDRYPQVKDSFLMRINNQGVAAGYVATETAFGPYLPMTYPGAGRFQTLGNRSIGQYFSAVTGINDRGDVVGDVANGDGSRTAYVDRAGTIQAIVAPAGAGAAAPYVVGINAGGTAYGDYTDANGLGQVFTAAGSSATRVPLAIAGFDQFSTDSHLLSNAGILGVYAASANYSNNATLLYDTATAKVSTLDTPAGFAYDTLTRITATAAFGYVDDADFNVERLASWNLDGSFRGFIDLPMGLAPDSVQFNDLGQAIALARGVPMFYDGTSWSARVAVGAGDYRLAGIDDFNDRGDFVGLADNGHGFEYGFVALATVPEPASAAMVALGLAGAAAAARIGRRGGAPVRTSS